MNNIFCRFAKTHTMKNLSYIILFCFVVVSCSTATIQPPIKETVVVDYSYYYNRGFFITESNSVNFDYKPLGSVITYLKDGYKVSRNMLASPLSEKNTKLSVNDALRELVISCQEAGANGIINLKISIGADSYTITGMAIKK